MKFLLKNIKSIFHVVIKLKNLVKINVDGNRSLNMFTLKKINIKLLTIHKY